MRSITSIVFGIVVVVCTSAIVGSSQTQPATKEADWQSDWAKFVEAFNVCLKSTSGCTPEHFKDKPVTWSGVLKSLNETDRSAVVIMAPASPPLIDNKGQTGAFSCCLINGIADFDAWKALAPGTAVTFTAILGKDWVPVVMVRGIGAVILREGRLAPNKNP